MNRKQFLSKIGITKGIAQGLWSFVHHEKKMVVFGAWDYNTERHRAKILDTLWSKKNDRFRPGYTTAIKHLSLLEQGYSLYIFIQEPKAKTESDSSLRIGKIHDRVELCQLRKIDSKWYAYRENDELNPDELDINEDEDEDEDEDDYYEGSLKIIKVNAYERNKDAREKCLQVNGVVCKGCNFDFEKVYGEHGKGFIHVHHKIPLSEIRENYKIDPVNDLIPLCPNCHAMVHRYKGKQLTVNELKELTKIV